MIIPREKKLVRIYCQLNQIGPVIDDRRIDRSGITPERILKAAQDILYPFKLEYTYCAWWTSYQVRLYDTYIRHVLMLIHIF